jgi:CheY-like chemotaxis protein/chemotaxis protein CheY-P-specific phosphatase CheC
MGKFPKLQNMLVAALNHAAQDGGLLLGHELAVKETEGAKTIKQEYMSGMEDASFVVGVKSQEEYDGTFYMVFSLRDAIVFGSLLLGVPLARVSEKRKLAIIDTDDIDAFSEFTNQIIGSFNSVFKSSLPKKVHLKLKEPKKFIPNEDKVTPDAPVPDGEYFVLRAQLLMPEQKFDQVDILIPIALASLFDLQGAADLTAHEEEQAEAEPAKDDAETGPPATDERTVLILENNSLDRQFFQETLLATEIKTMAAALDADLSDFFPDTPVKAVLLGVDDADDRELSICIKIRTISTKDSLPVIMCAREWTRTAVLKALKYGASDIIIKPCAPDELRGRVLKLLDAA